MKDNIFEKLTKFKSRNKGTNLIYNDVMTYPNQIMIELLYKIYIIYMSELIN